MNAEQRVGENDKKYRTGIVILYFGPAPGNINMFIYSFMSFDTIMQHFPSEFASAERCDYFGKILDLYVKVEDLLADKI